MENIKILSFHEIFNENAYILAERTKFKLITSNYKPQENDILIVFGGHTKIGELLSLLHDFKKIKIIFIQTEQLKSAVFSNKYYLKLLKMARVFVFDWSFYNAKKLKDQYGINVRGVYCFDYYGRTPDIEWNDRPIDICFIGARSPERVKLINKLKEFYPNLKFFVDFDYSLTNQNKLVSVLQKCKFVLNIPFYDDACLETHRILRALSCGCKVISPISVDDDLNQMFREYVYFGTKPFKTIDLYLKGNLTEDKKNYEHFITNIMTNFLTINMDIFKKIIEAEIEV